MNRLLCLIAFLCCWHIDAMAQGNSRNKDKTSVAYRNNYQRFAIAHAANSSYEIRNGRLYTTGLNTNGQLGIGSTSNQSNFVQVGSDTIWYKVAAGYQHAAGIKADGTMWTWGNGVYGRLGLGNSTQYNSPQQVGNATDWVSVYCGFYTTFGIKADGSLWGWGLNQDGELGIGNSSDQNLPQPIAPGSKWLMIAASKYHANAIRSDGTLWGWGYNAQGQVGDGSNSTRLTPVQVGTDNTWVSVSCNAEGTALALKADGSLWSWGIGSSGQLGTGNLANQSAPSQVPGTWAFVVSGGESSYAIKSDGTLWAWGYNTPGQIGIGNSTQQNTPVQIGTDNTWAYVYPGVYFTRAIKTDGSAWAWGDNSSGQFGNGSSTTVNVPQQLMASNSVVNWVSMSLGGGHNLALQSTGTLWAWGHNDAGQLGTGNTTDLTAPTQINSVTKWISASAGANHSIGLQSDGTIWSWGNNTSGQLGYSGGNQVIPTQVGSATDWVSISAGEEYNIAMKVNGTIWSWGKNDKGQLGDGTNTNHNALTQIGSDNKWISVAAGKSHTLALKSNGTLWAWGNNADGQLGLGNTTDQNTPQQVGSDNKWIAVSAGDNFSIGMKVDGTLWAWGNNTNGQLGQGNTVSMNQPTQVGTATDWVSIDAGGGHVVATRSTGSIYVWGRNGDGQLGLASTADQMAPALLVSQPMPAMIKAGSTYSARMNYSRQQICMSGSNTYGELGIGNTTSQTTFTCPGGCTPPAATITPAGATSVCTGGTVQLDANTGSGLTYKWYKDNVLIGAATTASYTATASGAYTVEVDNGSCSATSTAVNVYVGNPSVILGTAPSVCAGATGTLSYNTPVGNPTTYSINWDVFANSAGLADVSGITLSGGNISITVPANVTPSTYGGSLTVSNGSCTSSSIGVNITIKTPANAGTITGVTPVCVGGTETYTSNGSSGGTWSSDNNATASVNSSSGAVTGVNPGTTNINYTVTNGSSGCQAVATKSVTVTNSPSITLGTAPTICSGITTASVSYTATTGSPDKYSIIWGGAAAGAGFANVTNATLPFSPISVAVPAGAGANTYTGFLFVSSGNCVGNPATITVNVTGKPTITLGSNPSVCPGVTTALLPYSATTGSPNQYSITWDVAATGQGFADVSNASLAASNISLVVPANAAANTYSGTLTVKNASCTSNTYNISVTVNAPPAVDVINGGSTMCVGEIDNFTNNTIGGVWSSDNASVATVSGTGTVEGIAAGNTTIRYTVLDRSSGCSTVVTKAITVNGLPDIVMGANPSICSGITTAQLPFSGTSGSPNQYSIIWSGAAATAGFTDVFGVTLSGSPIYISVPSNAAANNYTGMLTVTNGTCVSLDKPVSVNVLATPTITLGNNPSVCTGTTTASLPFSATTGSPNQYSVIWNTAASTAGFVDASNATLSGGAINLAVPSNAATGTYTGTLTVRNSSIGCISTDYTVSVTVVGIPTITLGGTPSICPGTTVALHPYTATTAAPTTYSITWSGAAAGAGFTNVVDAALPANDISITVPSGAGAGSYLGFITVSNGTCTSGGGPLQAIGVNVQAAPTITLGADPSVCAGVTTASLPYTATTGGPNQYSITWNSAATTAGFINVTNGSLSPSPISITVPAGAAPATYSGTLTVRNSSTGCVSGTYNTTVSVIGNPTITLGGTPSVCSGATTALHPYTGTTSSPTTYSITWGSTASGAGFTNVTNAALPASNISLAVPAGATAGTYVGAITVSNSGNCTSGGGPLQSISVTVTTTPTITLGSNPSVCAGITSATLPYTATTGSPDQYSITWNSAATTAGFTNVTNASLQVNNITLAVPGAATAATYNGTMTIRNSITGCVSTVYNISVTVNANPTITLGGTPSVCAGVTSVLHPYTATTATPTAYSITWGGAATTAGFTNVTNASLQASNITLAVPSGAAAGTYTGAITVSNANNCSSSGGPLQSISVTVLATPTITLGSIAPVCAGATSASLPYTATTGTPNQYSITWNSAATTAGFGAVTNAAMPSASPFTISVPGAAAAGTYSGTLTVRNSTTGCVSASSNISITINALPTITLGANPSVCAGATTGTLAYTATTGAPDQYSIGWNSAATTAGFAPVNNASLAASPLAITVPGAAAPATYNGTLTVRNSATGCVSTSANVNVIVNALPTITLGNNPSVCAGVTTATLPYTTTTGSPDGYSITWNSAAQTAGFVAVNNATLVASNISIATPATAAPGTYSGTLTVRSSTTGCTSGTYNISVGITGNPTITLGNNPSVCAGATTAVLPYTATTGSPTNYSITWNSAATTAGFTNVASTSLPANNINLAVPAAAAPGTYTGAIVVSNSSCSSAGGPVQNITVAVNALPTITVGANPTICAGITTATLPYTATTGTPNEYSIVWNSAATTAGFTNVTNAALLASSISITAPAGASAGTYSGTLTVRNSTTGCVSTSSNISVTLIAVPTITTGSNPAVCQGATSATLAYSGTANGPNQYSISWSTAAQTAGFTAVTNTSLPSSPITITVPGGAAAATYGGTLTVRNTNNSCVSAASNISVVVNATPTITWSTNPTVCQGETKAELPYTVTTNAPTQYAITWSSAATTAGFTNVPATALPANDVDITVPAAAAPGSYSGTVTVGNASCLSSPYTFNVSVNEMPVANITANGPVEFCQGDDVELDATVASTTVTYQWWNGNAMVGINSPKHTADVSGSYKVVVTSNGICADTSAAQMVTAYSFPSVRLDAIDTAFCAGNSITLNAVSTATNVSYRWKEGGNTIPLATASFYSANQTGSYSVVLTRNNVANCSDSSAPVAITVHPLPQPVVTHIGDTVRSNGGYMSYQWLRNAQPITGATDSEYVTTQTGFYSVSVTDSNGCSAESTPVNVATVSVPVVANGAGIKVYPNPSNALVNISAPYTIDIRVNSVDGKELIYATDAREVNLGNFADGIYMLRIYTQQGLLIKTERLVKTQIR